MRQELAERVLAKVMKWDEQTFGREYPILNRLAQLKYDEYQQYLPGRKFIESLGLWLRQFKAPEDREIAYEWIKQRLVFVSSQEMSQLVESSYQDFVRPILLKKAAEKLKCSSVLLSKISESAEFKSVRRRSLFLGLSDGSRMDVFRRSAGLDNEQVWQAYEIGDFKARSFSGDLQKAEGPDAAFENVFLIDDFTASGTSYFREEGGERKGKIERAVEQISAHNGLTANGCQYYILFYIATEHALSYLANELEPSFRRRGLNSPIPVAIYTLSEEAVVVADSKPVDEKFLALVDGPDYYRERPMDSHELKGKTADMKRGYAGCSLPVILVHNTPNNSLYLLWANEENSVRGLFPRVTRHKDA